MEIIETKTGEIYLTGIPHRKGNLTFKYPAFKGTYLEVAEQIDKAGLKRPTSPEVASLVYNAFFSNPKGIYEYEIRSSLNTKGLWEFTGNLPIFDNFKELGLDGSGVIIEHNPGIKNGELRMHLGKLVKRLQNSNKVDLISGSPILISKDGLVSFVSFDSHKGAHRPWGGYLIARYGDEAEKIAAVSREYNDILNTRDPCCIAMCYLGYSRDWGGYLKVDNALEDKKKISFGRVPKKELCKIIASS